MSSTKPTILFIHGSWHTPKHFQPVRDLFHDHGYTTSCPLLPSTGSLPPIGLIEDAKCIASELDQLVNVESKNVIVVAHSYGGMVASQAVDKEFGNKERESKGKSGGVMAIVYLCAFIVPLGESLGSALGGGPAPDTKLPPFIPVEEDGSCMMLDPRHRFYNDLPSHQQDQWTAELTKCPAIAQLTPLTNAAYLNHPVTYLFCENDQALPVFLQHAMVQTIEEKTGVVLEKATCDAGHSPFLSQPETVLDLIAKIDAAQK